MSELVLAFVTAAGETETEPVLAGLSDDRLVLDLDDGTRLDLSWAELQAAVKSNPTRVRRVA